jgi:hypothetical protein
MTPTTEAGKRLLRYLATGTGIPTGPSMHTEAVLAIEAEAARAARAALAAKVEGLPGYWPTGADSALEYVVLRPAVLAAITRRMQP